MRQEIYEPDDEISLIDIYLFLKEGWVTIVATTLLGSALGVGTALSLPVRYQATALIEPAMVMGDPVETVNVLAEKLRFPSYYHAETFVACGLTNSLDPAQALATALKPTIAKQSANVTVSFKSDSPKNASACLKAVLENIHHNQNNILEQRIALAMSLVEDEERKLKQAENFVATLSGKKLNPNAFDTEASQTALVLATLQTKQTEITELKSSIHKTRLALTAPQTKAASFAAPIYAPPTKAEPKRSLIAVISTLAGGFAGLMLLFLRRAAIHIKEQSKLRQPEKI